MRRILIPCLALACVIPAMVAAQGPESVGLWFDPDYTVNAMDAPPGTVLTAYLVLHEPSADALVGVEFRFSISNPQLFLLGSVWSHDPTVFEGGDCTIAAYATPRLAEPAMLLVTFTFLTVATGEVVFRVLPCPEAECPLYGTPDGDFICMTTVIPDGVVGCLNCTVGTEAVNWSAVKSLYR